jgi:hypothetical protein
MTLASTKDSVLLIHREILLANLLGAALIIPSFGQFALNTSGITSTTATLRWNKSTDRELKGYRLHCGLSAGGHYSKFVDVGNATTYTLSNLIPGKKYYCVVRPTMHQVRKPRRRMRSLLPFRQQLLLRLLPRPSLSAGIGRPVEA